MIPYIKISANNPELISEYRLEQLNGTTVRDWQSSSVFSNVPKALAYRFMARDSEGCTDSFVVQENPLQIQLLGARVEGSDIIVNWRTNVPAQFSYDWGVSEDPDEATRVEYNTSYSTDHSFQFPVIFLGSIHYFRVRNRTLLFQEVESDYYGGIIIAGEIIRDAESNLIGIYGDVEIIEINYKNISATAGKNNFDSNIYISEPGNEIILDTMYGIHSNTSIHTRTEDLYTKQIIAHTNLIIEEI